MPLADFKFFFRGSGKFDPKTTTLISLLMSVLSAGIYVVLLSMFAHAWLNYGFIFTPTFLPPPDSSLTSIFVPNPTINLTKLLQTPALPFHVIVGSHDIGKSTAAEVAASEVSQFRTVFYLQDPPTDYQFEKLFYRTPAWLTTVHLLETFLSFGPVSFDRFRAAVNLTAPPILVIDNIQLVQDITEFMASVKKFANLELMKIVLVCSSSSIAATIADTSAMSRGQFVLFPSLPKVDATALLTRRGFQPAQAQLIYEQVGSTLSKLKSISVDDPQDSIDTWIESIRGKYMRCVKRYLPGYRKIHSAEAVRQALEIENPDLQDCFLQRNLLTFNPLRSSMTLESGLVHKVLVDPGFQPTADD